MTIEQIVWISRNVNEINEFIKNSTYKEQQIILECIKKETTRSKI